jgi:hypothetical protein
LYSTAESEQWDRELEVQAALAELQQAMLKLQGAQDRLADADRQIGRAQHIARESGFSDVFSQRTHSIKDCAITSYHRMQSLFCDIFEPY